MEPVGLTVGVLFQVRKTVLIIMKRHKTFKEAPSKFQALQKTYDDLKEYFLEFDERCKSDETLDNCSESSYSTKQKIILEIKSSFECDMHQLQKREFNPDAGRGRLRHLCMKNNNPSCGLEIPLHRFVLDAAGGSFLEFRRVTHRFLRAHAIDKRLEVLKKYAFQLEADINGLQSSPERSKPNCIENLDRGRTETNVREEGLTLRKLRGKVGEASNTYKENAVAKTIASLFTG